MTKQTGGVFGQWLRDWRKANRYSMGAFGDLSGVSKVQVCSLERDPAINPRLETLMAISKATKTPIEQVARMAAIQRLAMTATLTAPGADDVR